MLDDEVIEKETLAQILDVQNKAIEKLTLKSVLSKDKVILSQRNFHPETFQKMKEYQEIRKLPFFRRFFRKIENGSLRGAVLTWMRLTMGIGIFAVPFYVKEYGLCLGVFVVLLCGLLNYSTFRIIFSAAEELKKPSYPEIVVKVLGKQVGSMFEYTLLTELCANVILGGSSAWNLF